MKKICKNCEQEYEVLNKKNRGFCSRDCYYESLPLLMKGNDFWKKTVDSQFKNGHPNYTPAKSTNYHRKIYKNWRLVILQRDNFICQGCGEPADVVHHPKTRKEHPELIVDPSNGVSLCRKCHMGLHRKDIHA